MPRNLNARQLKFAAAVASGKTQTAAYEEAGYVTNGKPSTKGRKARRLAKNGEIRRKIEELQIQLLPDPGDVLEIRAHAAAVIVGLSVNAMDERVRLQAAQWLHEEMGKQMAKSEERPREEPWREQVMSELRVLYAKALPEQLLVEAVSDRAGKET